MSAALTLLEYTVELGGMLLGPFVQKYAFGEFWTGWPNGHDLTDNKTLIMWLVWAAALYVVMKYKTRLPPSVQTALCGNPLRWVRTRRFTCCRRAPHPHTTTTKRIVTICFIFLRRTSY